MRIWYFHCPGQAERAGPLDDDGARHFARLNPQALAWCEDMEGWVPVAEVAALRDSASSAAASAGPQEIGFQIVGHEMQFVEITLGPGQAVIAEAGALMFKDAAVQMDTVLGSGHPDGGLVGSLVSAGRRVLTGERAFTTVYQHAGPGSAQVAFAAPYPGTVLPMRLDQHGGRLICQKESFLAGARGVRIGVHFQRRIMTGLFGGEGFIMQALEGDGWVFIHAGGSVVERELAAGQQLDVDTGCVVAFQASVQMDVRRVRGIKSVLFGGEGMFLATLTGPGKVWLQSLPFSRLAGRLLLAAPQGRQRG